VNRFYQWTVSKTFPDKTATEILGSIIYTRNGKLKILRFFAGLAGVFLVEKYISQHSLLRAKRCFWAARINNLSGVELALIWHSIGVEMAFFDHYFVNKPFY
jgi:hypothetical protein